MSGLPFDPDDESTVSDEIWSDVASEHKSKPQTPLTVTQAAVLVRTVLSDHLPDRLAVVGEISNFTDRNHWYFSIKDTAATLRCVCFASSSRRVKFKPVDGMQVVIRGRIDFYDAQGHIQLYVETMQPVGQGALEQRLRQLISELRELGYFDIERKKPLPVMPLCIAVVTSRKAAALQDVINTASRRWAGCRLLLYDVHVQGESAAPEIAAALDAISRYGPELGIDAVILTRGGGSIEDLWAFNERIVADAIYQCRLPIVAAIGHETDSTIAELVADVRCATPTQAAMTLIGDKSSLEHQLYQYSRRLSLLAERLIQYQRQRLDSVRRHTLFRRPATLVAQAHQRLITEERHLRQILPHRVKPAARDLEVLYKQLLVSLPRRLARSQVKLESCERHLEAMGPVNVLKRGYSYTLNSRGQVVRHADDVGEGDRITTVLQDSRFSSRVESNGGKPKSRKSRGGAGTGHLSDQGKLFD